MGFVVALLSCFIWMAAGCRQQDFPNFPANYREYAYISNGGSNTVTVLDVVNMRQDRVIAVGSNPTGMAVNPRRNEVYVVNSGSDSVTVIDAEKNVVAATMRVQKRPYSIDVDSQGQRAYVANSKSNNVSVLDLARRREIGVVGAGEGPGMARIANDGRTLVITNHDSGSVSIADVRSLKVRSSFDHCPGATDAIILPDSSKAFIACSGGHQIMVIGLAHSTGSDPLPRDVLLTFLDVGNTPVHLALKPDGGEAFVSNFNSDTISELTTSTDEVGGAYLMGTHPVRGLVSADNSLLYVSDFGAGRVGIYSIDDGKLIRPGVKVGEGPDALAFAGSGHFLLVADAQSGDIAVVRTASPASLLTLLPAGRSPNDIVVKAFLVH
ncbi:MAG TPA: YncE family protein [Acidobacteriaceae bacterium]|nr:YncE family protein [Acidobacteriaceae bacterium]